jgi:hypothetical protein
MAKRCATRHPSQADKKRRRNPTCIAFSNMTGDLKKETDKARARAARDSCRMVLRTGGRLEYQTR